MWYVLQLKPNGLKIAQANLARQGYRTFMPMREKTQQSKQRLQNVKRPLFPGYLFFGFEEGQVNWRSVTNTRGVTRVVTGTAGQPTPIPTEVVDGLINATTQNGILMTTSEYQAGDSVSVINGPFAGWLAEVTATDDQGRVKLLIDLMGRKTPVAMAGMDVEKRNL